MSGVDQGVDQSVDENVDVVVIGGGVGGLAAAICLGAEGKRVTLLERGAQVGGKLGTVVLDGNDDDGVLGDGVEVDTGPSVLTLPHIIDGVLQRAGMSLSTSAPLRSPVPAFRYHFPKGMGALQLDVFVDADETLRSVERSISADAARELRAFLVYAKGIWDASKDDFVFREAPSFSDLIRLGLTRPLAMTKVDPLSSMRGAIERRVSHPALRALLLRYATYNGSDPLTAPATLNCIAHVELGLGAFGVTGGMGALRDAMRAAADKVGVKIVTGADVSAIIDDGARVTGVSARVGGEDVVVHASAVVVNADVAHCRDALLSPAMRSKAKLTAPTATSSQPAASMSGCTAIIKARRRSGERQRIAHEVLFCDNYVAEFDDIFRQRRGPREPTVYVCAQEAAHGRRGWRDHEPLFVMVNLPALQGGAVDDGDAIMRAALGRLRAADMIDDDDQVVWQRSSTGLSAAFPGSLGSLYGAASNTRQSAFTRAKNAVSSVPGLFLASGSAHPGGGVPLCVQSGILAADAVGRDLAAR